MRSFAKQLSGLAVAALSSFAAAQSNVGELLDAGGKRMSAEDFRAELEQRVLIGLTATGGAIEIIYLTTGTIEGRGRADTPFNAFPYMEAVIGGQWSIDQTGSFCTTMRTAGMTLPNRCQVWFKLGDAYFVSDSDSDRHAKVLKRTVKP